MKDIQTQINRGGQGKPLRPRKVYGARPEGIKEASSISDILAWFQVETMRWCSQEIKDSRPAFYKTRKALIALITEEKIKELGGLLDAQIIKPEYHNMVVGKITELKIEKGTV